MNLRGKQNFASGPSKKMLSFVKMRMVSRISSFNLIQDVAKDSQTVIPVSHEFKNQSLSDTVLNFEKEERKSPPSLENAPERLADTALAIYHLRSEIHALFTNAPQSLNVALLQSILQSSRALDRALLEWRQTLPPTWEIRTNPSAEEQEALFQNPASAHSATWLGSLAIYPTKIISDLFNQFRMHRIIVQTIIIRVASRLATVDQDRDKETSNETVEILHMEEDARRASLELVDEICASIPFHLGSMAPTFTTNEVTSQVSFVKSAQVHHFQCAPTALNILSAHDHPQFLPDTSSPGGVRVPFIGDKMGSFMLLQALIVAASVPGIPGLQRSWMLQKALEACERTGVDKRMIESRIRDVAFA